MADEKTKQIAVRLAAETLARIEVLRKQLCRPGLAATRTDAIRVAIVRGLNAGK